MKFIFAIVFAILAAVVRSGLIITQPLQSSNWKPGTTVPITWMNTDRTQQPSGTFILDLMEGSDASNLNYVLTLSESQDASKRMLKYYVPSDLPSSRHYTLRITTENGDQFYSSIFAGGSGDAYNGQLIQQVQPTDDNAKNDISDSGKDKDADTKKDDAKKDDTKKDSDKKVDDKKTDDKKDDDKDSKYRNNKERTEATPENKYTKPTESDSDDDSIPTSSTKYSNQPKARVATDNLQLLSGAQSNTAFTAIALCSIFASFFFI